MCTTNNKIIIFNFFLRKLFFLSIFQRKKFISMSNNDNISRNWCVSDLIYESKKIYAFLTPLKTQKLKNKTFSHVQRVARISSISLRYFFLLFCNAKKEEESGLRRSVPTFEASTPQTRKPSHPPDRQRIKYVF